MQIKIQSKRSTMSGFCSAMAMTMTIVFFFLFLQQTPLMAVAAKLEEDHFIIKNKPTLYDFSSRDEMVHLAGYGEEKLSTVLVTGTVLCEACHQRRRRDPQPQLRSWPISGALVSVKCETPSKTKSGTTPATTDEYGDFMIDLPSHLHGVADLQKICTVKVIGIPKESMCRPAFVKKHEHLRLSSVRNGIRTYTAGRIRFQDIMSKPSKSCITRATNTNKQIAS
ncbi:hypothetical protein ERO13_D06G217400v2 [Gossypium hirsutum]|uniref:Pollen Ole e 1 allergen and extensin family protein n=1 Tax=Gossypium hirsutum TaxID=3635 RepID=A0A1U8PWZ7_GOSHI|nr:uncharacterized protein LOC107963727 [Gossypium hirsutum]KAG4143840.1 hypothetical protein ERO13_D06G217400v2 [Gossypium hirsutum]